MIRRHVLAALARGISAGTDDAAREALRKIDWAIRKRAKRKLETALIDAALATNELGGADDPDAARHVQRAAALQLAKVQVDLTDRERVTAAYAALPPVKAPRLWLATSVLGLAAVAAVVGSYVYIDSLPGRPSRAYARPLPPPAAGAFKDGGVPLGDPEIEKLLVGNFTQLVLQVDRDRGRGASDRERKERVADLFSAPAIVKRGPALLTAWHELIRGLDRWVGVPSDDLDREARELREKVRRVSDQLAAAGIGYYLEGDIFSSGERDHAVVYTYRVDQVVYVKAGTEPRRVLSLRRLDRLNLGHSLLGMQSQELGDPVVLLDQIEEHVAETILPALALDAPYELGDREWLATGAGKRLGKAAGDAVRRDLRTALGADANAARKIAELLAERAKIVNGWREDFDRRGYAMVSTDDKLFLPEDLLAELEGEVSNTERDRVMAIEETLAALQAPRIASKLEELVTATVRRHEAQHGMDDDRPLAYPAILSEMLGPAAREDGEPFRRVVRVRAELAAYISQIANDPALAQLSLWMVARHAFGSARTAEYYSGIVILDGLARHAGITGTGPGIDKYYEVDLRHLASRAEALALVDNGRLREAARSLWRELYGKPIVPIVDK
ncbi:MAG TPA: hypothetical protein VIU61_26490 [Kofleriaceae bacterium]